MMDGRSAKEGKGRAGPLRPVESHKTEFNQWVMYVGVGYVRG